MLSLKSETVSVVKSRKSKSKVAVKATRRKLRKSDVARAVAFFSLALCGLGVSLPHLAQEIGGLTGSAFLASWLIAIVIDLGMVVNKWHLSANGPDAVIAWAVLGACTLVSIVLNCHAFFGHAMPGFGQVAAIGFGIFLPLFILALSYLGSEILLGKK